MSGATFDRAIAAIDAANADDPNIVTVREITGPKEVVHAELVTEWVRRLRPDAERRVAPRGASSSPAPLDGAAQYPTGGPRRLSALAQGLVFQAGNRAR